MSVLDAKHFRDEAAAYAFVEARVWATGRVCPHCKVVGQSTPLKGKTTRIGLYKCYACRRQFTVKVGTVFESSHIELHIWLQAILLLASSKKGIGSNQLARTLGVTFKTARFLGHRIREAMKEEGFELTVASVTKAPEPDEKPQHERFKELAREVGADDETGEHLKQLLDKLVRPSRKHLLYHRDE